MKKGFFLKNTNFNVGYGIYRLKRERCFTVLQESRQAGLQSTFIFWPTETNQYEYTLEIRRPLEVWFEFYERLI